MNIDVFLFAYYTLKFVKLMRNLTSKDIDCIIITFSKSFTILHFCKYIAGGARLCLVTYMTSIIQNVINLLIDMIIL